MTDTRLTRREPEVHSLAPKNIEQAFQLAGAFAKTELVPKGYRGKPEAIVVAWQFGAEIGLQPMQALQSIAEINGIPAIFGDAAIALCKGSPHWIEEDYSESWNGEPFNDDFKAVCTVRRRDGKPVTREFTVADAKLAGLWKKSGPWTNYPKRMLQMRARAWALRDVFPDVLKGLYFVEEARDIPLADYEVVSDAPPEPASMADKVKAKMRPASTAETEPVDSEANTEASEPETKPAPETEAETVPDNPATLFDGDAVPSSDDVAAQLKAAGIRTRQLAAKICSKIVGREIASSIELTDQERQALWYVLEKAIEIGGSGAAAARILDFGATFDLPITSPDKLDFVAAEMAKEQKRAE